MSLIDGNLLLNAYESSSEHHKSAKGWFEEVLSQPEPVRLAWMTILAFLRISTNPRLCTSAVDQRSARGGLRVVVHSQRPDLEPYRKAPRNHEHPLACCPGLGTLGDVWPSCGIGDRHWG